MKFDLWPLSGDLCCLGRSQPNEIWYTDPTRGPKGHMWISAMWLKAFLKYSRKGFFPPFQAIILFFGPTWPPLTLETPNLPQGTVPGPYTRICNDKPFKSFRNSFLSCVRMRKHRVSAYISLTSFWLESSVGANSFLKVLQVWFFYMLSGVQCRVQKRRLGVNRTYTFLWAGLERIAFLSVQMLTVWTKVDQTSWNLVSRLNLRHRT